MNAMSFLRLLWARKWIALTILGITVIATIVATSMMPSKYTAVASVVVDPKGKDAAAGTAVQPDAMSGYMATQADILGSRNVALKVVDKLNLTQDPFVRQHFMHNSKAKIDRDRLADALLRTLDVKLSRESNVFNVSYTADDSKFAQLIANAFVQAYIQTNLDMRTGPALESNKWYEGQIQDIRDHLETAQKRLSDYQRSKGIVAVDERLDVETQRLADLSHQLVAAQGQTFDSQSRNRRSGDQLAEVINNPLIQSIKSDLLKAEAKRVQLSNSLGVNHPDYQRAQAEVDTLRQKLAQETRNAETSVNTSLRVAQQRESELSAAVAAQKAKIMAFKQQRDEGAVLTQDVTNIQKAYDQALQRATQTRMESQANQTDVSVLNPAIAPLKPSGPNLLLNVALAIVFGATLGIASAWLAEMRDRRVRSEDDLLQALGVPVLVTLGSVELPRQARRLSGHSGLLPNQAGAHS
ncbi:MAG TPA: chain length determinant protein EpsF [Sulfuriferula sp.]|nr:chain length determinant protein EpsF [Sulfuriferula sp.]